MKLSDIKPTNGSKHRKKILGRGTSSGHGKTSARGQKGQKARTGGKVRLGFEGGQTPFYRRIPKIGRGNMLPKTKYQILNLGDIEKLNITNINPTTLLKIKRIKTVRIKIKILGDGNLTKKVTIAAHKFSKSAEDKIKKAGGLITVI